MWPLLLRVRARWLAARGERQRLAGRYDRAEGLVREALALADRVAPVDDLLRVRLLDNLGVIHKYQGRFREGAGAYLRALRIARRRRAPTHWIATLYHNLGGLEHSRGRHVRGEPFGRRAVELRERERGPNHPEVARDIAALAAIVDGVGRHVEAEAMHRRALAVFERRLGSQHREVAYALANLAACLHAQGRSREAEPLALRALELQEKSMGASHPEVAVTRSNLAAIHRGASTPPRIHYLHES